MTGRLLAIHLRPAARLPVKTVDRANAIAGQGLDGDHAGGGNRQVTLLAREAWAAACADLGREFDPSVRRANLLVEGVDLTAAIGDTLILGDVVIDLLGETRPCELMDDGGRIGLQVALRPGRRGGAYGRIRAGGELRLGMECRVARRWSATTHALTMRRLSRAFRMLAWTAAAGLVVGAGWLWHRLCLPALVVQSATVTSSLDPRLAGELTIRAATVPLTVDVGRVESGLVKLRVYLRSAGAVVGMADGRLDAAAFAPGSWQDQATYSARVEVNANAQRNPIDFFAALLANGNYDTVECEIIEVSKPFFFSLTRCAVIDAGALQSDCRRVFGH